MRLKDEVRLRLKILQGNGSDQFHRGYGSDIVNQLLAVLFFHRGQNYKIKVRKLRYEEILSGILIGRSVFK